MDQRETFANVKQLHDMLASIFDNKEKASFLVDDEGLTRLQGKITSLQSMANDETMLTIENEKPVTLAQVIAVNGIFRSDYSEC